MPLFHVFDLVDNRRTGVPMAGVQVRAKFDDTDTIAPIYADQLGTAFDPANYCVTDADGMFSFYIDSGEYTLEFLVGDVVLKTIPDFRPAEIGPSGPANSTFNATAEIENADVSNVSAILAEVGKAGTFTTRDYVDFTAQVAADPGKINYIRSVSDPTKVWVRTSILSDAASQTGASSGLTVDAELAAKATLTGVARTATHLGTFTGSTIPDSSTIKAAIQAVETAVENTSGNAATKVNATAVGVAATDANMGTTPGTILSDNGTAKTWFQESEAAIEARPTSAVLAAFDGAAKIGLRNYGPTNRTVEDFLNETINVYSFIPEEMWASVRDGTNSVDLAPFLQDFFDTCGEEKRVGHWSSGRFLIASPIIIETAVQIICDGFNMGPAPDTGTWIIQETLGFTPIKFTGIESRGSRLAGGFGVYQSHAVPGLGWAPTDYDYTIRIEDTLGEVFIDEIYLCGVNKGIYGKNAGRVIVGSVRGQWFHSAVELDDIYDVSRVDHVHAWIYYSTANDIVQYCQANADSIILRRADIPFLGKLFSFGYRSLVRLANGANGTANKVEIDTLMADFSKFGLMVDDDCDNATAEISIYQVQQEKYPQAGLGAITGSSALYLGGDHARVQISNFRSEVTGKSAIRVEGVDNRVSIGNFRANGWDGDNGGNSCFHMANAPGGDFNQIHIANTPLLERPGSQPIKNGSTNGVVYRNGAGQTGLLEGIWSEWNAGASAISQRPDGLSATIDHILASKGGGTQVALAPDGITSFRTDRNSDANTQMLVRAGLGFLQFWAEGAGADVNLEILPKGGGCLMLGNVRTFANDAAAAAASPPVPINGVYWNGTALVLRKV